MCQNVCGREFRCVYVLFFLKYYLHDGAHRGVYACVRVRLYVYVSVGVCTCECCI